MVLKKNSVIVGASIVGFLLLLYLMNLGYRRKENTYRNQIRAIRDSVKVLTYQRDSLKKEVELMECDIEELMGSAVEVRERIVYIKEQNDEKVDSIVHLPIDRAIEFFAEQVSSENGGGR